MLFNLLTLRDSDVFAEFMNIKKSHLNLHSDGLVIFLKLFII